MRTVEDHLRFVLSLVGPLPASAIGLSDALGMVLASDVAAPLGLPPFDNSAADGYAVRARDVASAPVTLPVSADIPAGSGMPGPLEPGSAARIMTGAPLPAGADSVARVEVTNGGVVRVLVREPVPVGADIRRADSDTRRGDVVLTTGTKLAPAQLGLLSGLGVTAVTVRRRPRIAIISTGSELVAPGNPLPPGSVYDSNSELLAALVGELGATVSSRRVLRDDAAAALPAFDAAADHADLIITSGGVSAGAYEVVKDVLSPTGDVTFAPVAMQPGKPQGAGAFRGTPIITLPGNPVSAFVSFQVFAAPALRTLAGHAAAVPPAHRARLTEEAHLHPRVRRYRRGWFDPAAGTARFIGGVSSHYLASLARSNSLVVLPPGVGSLAPGAEVDVMPFASC